MTESISTFKEAVFRGVTLVELSMAMMIIAVLSVGVASLIRVGVEAQLSERANQKMRIISMAIVDDLRRDIQMAQSVTIANGKTLVVEVPKATDLTETENVTYQLLANGRFRRSTTSATKTYNEPKLDNLLTVECVNAASCFNWASPSRTVLEMSGIRVKHTGFGNTVLDQQFGEPNYTVRDLTFDVPINRSFN